MFVAGYDEFRTELNNVLDDIIDDDIINTLYFFKNSHNRFCLVILRVFCSSS